MPGKIVHRGCHNATGAGCLGRSALSETKTAKKSPEGLMATAAGPSTECAVPYNEHGVGEKAADRFVSPA